LITIKSYNSFHFRGIVIAAEVFYFFLMRTQLIYTACINKRILY